MSDKSFQHRCDLITTFFGLQLFVNSRYEAVNKDVPRSAQQIQTRYKRLSFHVLRLC